MNVGYYREMRGVCHNLKKSAKGVWEGFSSSVRFSFLIVPCGVESVGTEFFFLKKIVNIIRRWF